MTSLTKWVLVLAESVGRSTAAIDSFLKEGFHPEEIEH